MRVFWDTEHQEYITLQNLQDYWDCDMDENEKEEYGDFESYVEACQSYNNGTLEELEGDMAHQYMVDQESEYYRDMYYEMKRAIDGGWY